MNLLLQSYPLHRQFLRDTGWSSCTYSMCHLSRNTLRGIFYRILSSPARPGGDGQSLEEGSDTRQSQVSRLLEHFSSDVGKVLLNAQSHVGRQRFGIRTQFLPWRGAARHHAEFYQPYEPMGKRVGRKTHWDCKERQRKGNLISANVKFGRSGQTISQRPEQSEFISYSRRIQSFSTGLRKYAKSSWRAYWRSIQLHCIRSRDTNSTSRPRHDGDTVRSHSRSSMSNAVALCSE